MDGDRLGQGRVANSCRTHENEGAAYRAAVEAGHRRASANCRSITGNRQYVFPNQHKPAKFMSENTMLYALYRMGYHSRTTGHGFRSTASTILNEHGFHAGRD